MTAAGILVVAIPTPREINLSCGQSLLAREADEASILRLLSEQRCRWSNLFSRDANARIYEKLKEHEV